MRDVDALVFDLYGTLLEVASVGRAAAEVTEDPARLVDVWRQKQLEYTWLRSLMGRHANFWGVTGDALDYALERLGLALDASQRDRLLGAWLDVTPYPEVVAALGELAPRRLVVLTNGSPDMVAEVLRVAGLDQIIDPALSVEEVGIYKPHPSVYAMVGRLEVPIEGVVFVSSNSFDAAGAKSSGLRVAWVNRAGMPFERLGVEPDLVVSDLNELAQRISAHG